MQPRDNMGPFGARRNLEDALLGQKAVQGDGHLAADLADKVELLAVRTGDIVIEEGADDHNIYFILAGCFEVIFQGSRIATKGSEGARWRDGSNFDIVEALDNSSSNGTGLRRQA